MTPPSLAGDKVFVGTDRGVVHCYGQETGRELWQVRVGSALVFPPAVTSGWCIAGTAYGDLVAFETGDPADDGWQMWGGTAAHNGLHEDRTAVDDPLPEARVV